MRLRAGIWLAIWADQEVACCHKAVGDEVEWLLGRPLEEVYSMAPQG